MKLFNRKPKNYKVLITLEYLGEVIKEVPMITAPYTTGRQARIDLQSNLVIKVGKAYKQK